MRRMKPPRRRILTLGYFALAGFLYPLSDDCCSLIVAVSMDVLSSLLPTPVSKYATTNC